MLSKGTPPKYYLPFFVAELPRVVERDFVAAFSSGGAALLRVERFVVAGVSSAGGLTLLRVERFFAAGASSAGEAVLLRVERVFAAGASSVGGAALLRVERDFDTGASWTAGGLAALRLRPAVGASALAVFVADAFAGPVFALAVFSTLAFVLEPVFPPMVFVTAAFAETFLAAAALPVDAFADAFPEAVLALPGFFSAAAVLFFTVVRALDCLGWRPFGSTSGGGGPPEPVTSGPAPPGRTASWGTVKASTRSPFFKSCIDWPRAVRENSPASSRRIDFGASLSR